MMRPQEPGKHDSLKTEGRNFLNYVEVNIEQYIQEMPSQDAHFFKSEFYYKCFYEFPGI